MNIERILLKLKDEHQVNQPGQPHISQAVGGEVVEVGQGGHVQEDHQGQVIFMVMGARTWPHIRQGWWRVKLSIGFLDALASLELVMSVADFFS